MTRFIEGTARSQVTLLPECLDDFVEADNPVRVVDAFVDMLDLAAMPEPITAMVFIEVPIAQTASRDSVKVSTARSKA